MLVDAELGYLRPLRDLIQRRRMKSKFLKQFARGIDDRLTKRLVSGPAASVLDIFTHGYLRSLTVSLFEFRIPSSI
ncbi:hypothetical protein AGR1C_pAt20039 [Agrobacterium fabacearum TT111]|nr:hypothetical protein AGR1C_pAt20039 [Agrobacterium fabacearum TT111]